MNWTVTAQFNRKSLLRADRPPYNRLNYPVDRETSTVHNLFDSFEVTDYHWIVISAPLITGEIACFTVKRSCSRLHIARRMIVERCVLRMPVTLKADDTIIRTGRKRDNFWAGTKFWIFVMHIHYSFLRESGSWTRYIYITRHFWCSVLPRVLFKEMNFSWGVKKSLISLE